MSRFVWWSSYTNLTSTFRGQPCYYLEHSLIEHIFLPQEET